MPDLNPTILKGNLCIVSFVVVIIEANTIVSKRLSRDTKGFLKEEREREREYKRKRENTKQWPRRIVEEK